MPVLQPLVIRFDGPATDSSTITIEWLGGYPPSTIVDATEEFKPLRNDPFVTSIDSDPVIQAQNFYYALTADYGVNFNIARTDNFVYVAPKNGTLQITATTDSDNIVINPDIETYLIINQPQSLTPVYNPVPFKFFSQNYYRPAYRYILDIYRYPINDTSSRVLIDTLKIAPDIDATGYVDISKILSSYVTYNWNTDQTLYNTDASSSYINFDVSLREEYQTVWNYDKYNEHSTAPFERYTILQSDTEDHNFVAGDQITVDTNLIGPQQLISGLHTVVLVIDAYTIVIDAIYPGPGLTYSTGTPTNIIPGTAKLASGTPFVVPVNDPLWTSHIICAFNGALEWEDWKNFDSSYMTIPDYDDSQAHYPLTYLPDNGAFLATELDQIWLNYAANFSIGADVQLRVVSDNSVNYTTTLESGALTNSFTIVKQIDVRPNTLGINPDNTNAFYDVTLIINGVKKFTFRIGYDSRCKIENNNIIFIDRYGSPNSFTLPLRSVDKSTITRETNKSNFQFPVQRDNYHDWNISDLRGTSTNYVGLVKEYELTTNWITDDMSLYYVQLLTSAYTWVTIGLLKYTYACLVTDTQTVTERQRNKMLLKKTLNIRMANDQTINI